MLDERCVNCPVIAECDIAVGYGSVVCTINKMRSGETKKTIMEHDYDNCHNLTCRRRCEKDGYNKAIDDFVEKLDNHTFVEKIETNYSNSVSFMREIRKMAEQLKNGRS